jgi:hypothetical protein
MINPLATGVIYEVCLNSSLAKVLEMWTSITGESIALIASPIATEVCV